jgi:hypothetical protein
MKILRTILGTLLAAGLSYASLVAPQSVADLEQHATLIVVATTTAAPNGMTNSFLLTVNRVVKGDNALTGSTITVRWTPPSANVGEVGIWSGIWFLKQSSTGWGLLPVVQGNVPLVMTCYPTSTTGTLIAAYAYASTASATDKLASELSSAVESSTDAGNFPLTSLHYGTLEQLQSPVITVLYHRLSSTGSPQQQALGFAGLVRQGSSAALTSAAKVATVLEGYPAENGILLLSIRDQFRASDARSVNALGQIAADTTANQLFREAAAHALSSMHTKESLPFLAKLLSDGDVTLRVEAIGGLASFANGLPGQTASGTPGLAHLQLHIGAPYQTAETIANFAMGSQAIEQNESRYLTFWQTWWSQQKSQLGY